MTRLTLSPEQSELIVLAVIRDRPAYGYAIAKRAGAQATASGFEGPVNLGPGKLYPLLAALEKQGFIEASWSTARGDGPVPGHAGADEPAAGNETAPASGRRRKWYSLTAKGSRRLARRIGEHRSRHTLIEKFIRGADPSTESSVS